MVSGTFSLRIVGVGLISVICRFFVDDDSPKDGGACAAPQMSRHAFLVVNCGHCVKSLRPGSVRKLFLRSKFTEQNSTPQTEQNFRLRAQIILLLRVAEQFM